MGKIYQVGIAGLGRTGWNIHARGLAGIPELFKVAAVSDPNPQRRAEAETEFGCRAYESFDELTADAEVDLIVVATPSHLHHPQTIQALRAGKNVVCEKPFATSLAEADEMIAVARETAKVLSPFQNRRYGPEFTKICEVIESGKLGRLVEIKSIWNNFGRRWDWQTLRKFGGGSLNNTGPHPVDQLVYLFGEGDPEIFCHMDRALTLGDAEDHVKVIMRGPGKPLIDLEISSADAFPGPRWTILGTQGGLTGSEKGLKWKYFNPADLPKREVSEEAAENRAYNKEEIPWQEESWEPPEDAMGLGEAFYRHLHQALEEGRAPDITADHARRIMAVLDECHRQTGI